MSAPPLDLGLLRSEIAELWAEVLRLKARVAELEGGRPAPSESYPSSSAAVGQPSSPTRPAAGVGAVSREEVCTRVGLFLRRSLEGGHRGTSSRDLLQLPSRYWIVVRSIEGQVFDPPRVFSRSGACKALVKRGTEAGDSIFVGLPAYKDVVLCLRAGGFREPAAVDQ